mgnify:CR=1 FL=1
MSIFDHINSNDKERVNALIKEYGPNNEFEASLFSSNETGSDLLTTEKYMTLNSVLHAITQKNEDEYKEKKERTLA